MTTLLAQRNNLIEALDDVDGFNVYGLTQNFDTPAILVYPRTPFEFHSSFVDDEDSGRTVLWNVEGLVNTSDLDANDDQLLGAVELIGTAIESVPNAGVLEVESYAFAKGEDGTEYVQVRFLVEYLA